MTRDSPSAVFDVHRALLGWYVDNKRDLPWRRDADPYRVLVSEVMLQQTQVDRVVPYFEAFVARFPTLAALAAAPRAEVVRIWGGLGYNRRAVHLHSLACIVVERYDGQLPSRRRELLALPGIGPYTAGAILSIGFGQQEAALDTNVRRVVGRYAFLEPGSKADLENAAAALLPPDSAGDWNQALMDLGSSICLGAAPRCLICPIRSGCQSAGRVSRLPRAKSAQTEYRQSNRYYRGRLLWRLRSLPPEATEALSEIASALAAQGVAEPPAGWQVIGEGLARDGLARVQIADDQIRLGLS